jgi:undecaprenyl diphosphate synthase
VVADPVLPRHVAIVMDGNGRWATARSLPRTEGHREGVSALRTIVEHCARIGIPVLTVFAFSRENWMRPDAEVNMLMDLFITALAEQVEALQSNGVNLRFIGDRDAFPVGLRTAIRRAEKKTGKNGRLKLQVAANYGGRWDITRACQGIAELVASKDIEIEEIDENLMSSYLGLSDLEDPDLFIRTGGERRISNFLLWELAYTELYFTDLLWPDFSPAALDEALQWFAGRERRFGRSPEQLNGPQGRVPG